VNPGSDQDSTITASANAPTLPTGSVLAGRYRIDGLLGIGGMGVVYRAFDLSLDVAVALKLLRPELSARADAFERFRKEVLLARQVSSPHVLRLHDIARDGERWFISMDLVDGEALDRRLARDGALPLETALDIATQVARGLAAAHAQGVVHRDLKPSNVLIDHAGHACIADFGIARSLRGSGLTQAGAVVGTPDYLSPEQARGLPVDARSDLYALGLVLFEMLTGQLPFSAQTASESLSQRIGGYTLPLRQLRPEAPVWLERLLARLLRRRTQQRLPNAEAVLAALQARRVPPDWRLLGRRLAIAATLLLLLGAGGWLLGRGGGLRAPLPDRVVVLPLAGTALDPAATRALDELLRRALDGSDLAVVDGPRSAALFERQPADADGWREEWPRELPARRWLRPTLRAEGEGLVAEAQWLDAAGTLSTPTTTQRAATVAAAWSALCSALAGSGASTCTLPADADALAALGEALQQRERGQLEGAIAGLAPLAGQWPAAAAITLEISLAMGEAAPAARSAAQLEGAGDPASRVLLAQQAGDAEAAEALLEAALAAQPAAVAARWRLAELRLAAGRLDEAEAAVQRGLEDDAGDPRGWFLRGKLAILRGDIRPAVDDYLVRAILLAKRDRNRFIEAEAVNALGVAYARLGQIADAEEQYRRALGLREAIGHRRGVASSLRNLAQLAMVQGRGEESAAQLARARALFAELDDRAGLAAVDNELGLLAEERGDYAAALAAYRLALRGREALADAHGIAESHNNLGFAQYQLGDYDAARVYWQQALDGFERLGDRAGRLRAQQNLGLLETMRGRWPLAERLLQDSLDEARAQQYAEERAVSARNLAELALLRGDTDAAAALLDEAEAGFAERADQRGGNDIALLRVRLNEARGDAAAAQAALDALLPQLAEASPEQQAIAHLLGAELALRRGDAAAARAALQRADAPVAASGIAALRLARDLLRAPADPALPAALRTLAHRPLQALWLEQRLRTADEAATLNAALAELDALLDELPGLAAGPGLYRLAAARLSALGLDEEAAQAEARAASLAPVPPP
jgi:eukaryotic-like serine/threonine-protein kinase